MKAVLPIATLTLSALCASAPSWAWTPKPVEDDPLLRMPGTQPGQVNLNDPKQCLSCHGGFAPEHWKGSMMAQASRDPMFWAAMTVTAQDSVYVLGNPNASDLCLRCHFPKGWLEGRSDPTNASLMTGEDYSGVQCVLCHYMYDPFYEETYTGVREGTDWTNYWDEAGSLSQPAANTTYAADDAAAATVTLFNGNPFFSNNVPMSAAYDENGSGQYFVTTGGNNWDKRASFADANAKHGALYSRHHKSKYLCNSCHDVSNPVLANLAYGSTTPGDGATVLPTEANPAYSYGHVERTFSEFMLSDYSQQGGAVGSGPYSPDRFYTSRAGNKIATCQDCHMADLLSARAGNSGVLRPDDSTEHPQSGVPDHRFVGGNAIIPWILASTVSGSANFDPTNATLLTQGPAVLTLDFSQGEPMDPALLLETSTLAAQMLQDSVSMTNAAYALSNAVFTLRLVNHTPHKLISGFPEGRRMFLNVKAYANDELIYEINPYDATVGTLKGLDPEHAPGSPALAPWEHFEDELVYEVHHSSSILGAEETFHIALATGRHKDNRIPPRGFRIAEAADRLCEPCWEGQSDTNYFTAAEYAGGYDELQVELPAGTERIEAGLYYQSTSLEYIEFLRDEINGTAHTLPGTGAGGDPAYIAQTNDFFSALAAWGDTIWQLWDHNRNVPGFAPVLMTNTLVQLDVSDTDGDGIPAYWEVEYFGGPTNAVAWADSDIDHQTNLDEYLAVTHPLDNTSLFRIHGEFLVTNGLLAVETEFDSRRSRFYALEQADGPLNEPLAWTPASADLQGTDEEMSFSHTNNAAQGTYRVKAKLPGTLF